MKDIMDLPDNVLNQLKQEQLAKHEWFRPSADPNLPSLPNLNILCVPIIMIACSANSNQGKLEPICG